MTTYVYEVRSDRPMAGVTGVGNMAVLCFPSVGFGGLVKRDEVHTVSSNGAATGCGTFTVELTERVEP